jgi:filamentous hemagglutinin family protein
MNHIYRLTWHRSFGRWVVTSELAGRATGGQGSRKRNAARRQALLVAALGLSLGHPYTAAAGPAGGVVVTGNGQITHSGDTTTIHQTSQNLSLNWQSFDVGAQETVNFVQPNAGALAVNRISSASASEILGHLNSNGQVWLINPNGVLFGAQAQVNVGGLVASTLDPVGDSSGDARKFTGNSPGTIVNQGTITAANGGYVALMGHQVSNQGIISAQLGTVALGAGSAETLTFSGNRLLHLQVNASQLNDLAENRKLIQADGGQVFMTAGAKDALLASVVNNTGVVQAESVENHNGTIVLLGGGAGTVNVNGTLDTSAPRGGNAGSIETSGANVNISATAKVTAAAPSGRGGTWLVDPEDLTIDSAAATTIAQSLNSGTSVTEQTTSTTASGAGQQSSGLGDINVDSAISWSNPATTLTLTAYHGINVNAAVSGAGQVVMSAGTGNLTLASGGAVSGQAGVTLTTGGSFINNAGASGVSAGSGARWLVYSTNPTLDSIGGLTPGFIEYNAPAGTNPTAAATGSGFLYSVAPTLTITALSGPVAKTYDGTTAATVPGSNMTVTGLLSGDTITSAGGTYASPDAASGINLTSTTDASTLVVAHGSTPVYGYALSPSTVTAGVGTISPKQLSAAIVGTPTKVYDGTTTATLSSSNYSVTGFVGTQGATVSQPSSVAYTSADASQTAVVSATFTSTNFTPGSGTNLDNYILPTTATGAGIINRAPVNLTGLAALDKTYDGTNAAGLNSSNASIFGVIQPDAGSVTLDTSGAAATFAQSNAGNNIAVTVTPGSFQLTGAKSSNYTLVAPGDLKASINPLALSLTNVAGTNKVYDGNSNDPLDFSHAALAGVLPIDSGNVTLATASATGTFTSPNAATGIGVSVNGVQLAGSAAGNYSVAQPTGVTANITPAPLAITLGGNQTKPYNGTTTASVAGTDFTITGFVSGESAAISQNALAQYASPNVGTHIPVTATLEASDFTAGSGTLMSNYSFPHTVTGNTGTITAIPLSASITNNPTKTYDGNTTATVASGDYVITGFVGSESATISQPNASYASPNVGAETVTATVTSANYTAGTGTLLSNYILPTTISGPGTIQPQPLGANYINGYIVGNPTKTYDGTTVATLAPANFQLTGFVAGQGATVTQTTGQYSNANAGKQNVTAQLTSGDFTPDAGTDLSNYKLPTVVYGTGTITPAPLSVSIVGNPTKVYDGTTFTQLTSANYHVQGFVTGENAVITPSSLITYDSKDVGARTITADLTASAYTPTGGTLLSNYVLPTSATGPGQITPAPLYVIGITANNKVYDATTAATLSTGNAGLAGLVAGESGLVTLNTSTSGTFSQVDVGNGIAVSTTGFSISGPGASNYSLQPLTTLHANITPAPLTIQQVTANDKSYDGTSADTLSTGTATLQGILNSDNVALDSSVATGTFASANAASNISVTASGFALTGPKAADYSLSQPTGLTATISPKVVTATITGNPTKPYDGTNSATLTSGDYQLNGFVAGQGATVPQSATANYLSANAGTNVGVQSTLVISDFVADAGTNLANYAMPSAATGTLGTITPKILNLSGTRVYDTTTDAAAGLFGSLTGLNGDVLTVSGTGTLVSKNVGTQSFTSLGTLTLNGTGGALASNYTLVGGTDSVKITPATLTVTGTTGSTKTYDGTTSAQISNATLSGVLSGDTVTLGNDTSGNFADKNVGNNKTIVTAMTISGADSGNYVLMQPSAVTGSITAEHITVTATGADRQYDGTVNDSAILASTGVVHGDSVSFSDTSATFGDPNVGNGKVVSVTGITATGADAGNYVLDNTSASTTANITPRVLNLTGTRQYDATTNADASLFLTNGTLAGVGTETLTLTGTGTLSSKNVANQQTFAASGLSGFTLGSDTGNATNYTLVGGTDWVKITPAPLTVINTAVTPKTYDGTTAAQLTGATLSGVLPGDVVTLGNDTTGTFVDKNVGTGKTVTTAMTLSNTDSGNYTLTQPTLQGDIGSKVISVSAAGANKSYDGTTAASVTLSSNQVAPGDTVTFLDTSATFASKDAAPAVAITVSGISATGADAGNYTLSNTTALTSADITKVVLDLTGTRVYDGTTTAAASLFGSSGTLSGVNHETVVLTGAGTLVAKDVNSSQAFASLSGFSLTDGSGSASNYTLVGGTDWVKITPLHVTVAATGANKTYDGGVLDPGLTLASTGVLSGDHVTFSDISATFSNKNAGTGKTVTVTGISISGGTDAGDYALNNTTASTTADINPKILTVSASASSRQYDGTALANVSLSTASGAILAGDTVAIGDTSATFSDANAATGKTVTVGGLNLSGSSASNYALSATTATTHADITPAVLDLTGARVYDGATDADASLFGTNGTLSTHINGETVVLTGTGTLSSKDVNPQQSFASLAGFSITNGTGLASNYTLSGGTDWVGITPLHITVAANGVNKVYDGGVLDPGLTLTSSGVYSGDHVTLSDASATFADKNAASGKTITVTGIGISGGLDAANYIVDNTTATTTASISARPITVVATGTNKVYDASTTDSVTLSSSQILAGDTVSFGDTAATFADKNVANGKTVTVTGITASGADAGNYSYNLGATTIADITPAPLTVVNIAAGSKAYDGTTTAFLSGATLQGVQGNDVLTLNNATSGTFADPNAGVGKAVTTAITVGGADARNYTFTQPTRITGNISQAVLNLTGSRQYDATADASASLFGHGGILTGVNGETLTLSGTGILASKNVSPEQGFASLTGFSLAGNGGALASNYTLAGGTDWVRITPAPLTAINTHALDKVYDGNTTAALTGATLSGLLAGDDVTLGNDTTGTFANKNVGIAKAVTTEMTLSGVDAANYTLAQPTGLTADISAKSITVPQTAPTRSTTDRQAIR